VPSVVVAGGRAAHFEPGALIYASKSAECPTLPPDARYAPLDTGEGLRELGQCLWEYVQGQAAAVPVYGLVLAGGRSVRMGTDKAWLAYHGRPQAVHAAELLARVCSRVYVSTRPGMDQGPDLGTAPRIEDTFLDLGPLGGILSAQRTHPNAAWLVLACDLPFVTEDTLRRLLKGRNPLKLATAFQSASDGLPEPVCAVYEPKSVFRLLDAVATGRPCPRQTLIQADPCLLPAPGLRELMNINRPEERDAALALLAREAAAP